MTLPQTQNPYVYVLNNPVNLTDPSGEIAPLLVIALGGAAIGGVSSAVSFVVTHPGQSVGDYVRNAEFQRAVGAGMVGGFIGGLIPGGGLLSAIVGGALSAVGAQLFVNLTTPCARWTDGLIEAAIIGGISGGIFYGVMSGFRAVAGRLWSGGRNPFDVVALARQRLGLPPRSLSPDDGYTVAVLKADGLEFVGANGRKAIDFPVNAISRDHAEIDALNQLYRARQGSGITGGTATMVVDRIPCSACDKFGGIRSGVEATGLDLLQVIHPDGVLYIAPR